MSGIPDIFPHGNRAEEFKEQADTLRELADDIEAGEIGAMSWVVIYSGDRNWSGNRWKSRGVSNIELIGAMFQVLHEWAAEVEKS